MLQAVAPSPRPFKVAHFLGVILLTVPWIQPFSTPPLANVVPWLMSWTCLALALLHWQHITATVVAQSWILAALISSLIGLIQFFGQADAFAPLLHVPAYLGDALGNLRQRNQLATLLSMGMLAVCWWYARGLALGHALWMQVLLVTGLAATASRTGLLQILLVVVGLALHRQAPKGRQVLTLGIASLGFYALASLALPWFLQSMSGQGTDNAITRMASLGGCGSRQVLWSNVLHLVAQQPLTGWGWDNLRYAHYITEYPGQRFCDILSNAHNLPLHLAFVWGVPVAVLLVLVLLVIVWRAAPWRYAGTDRQLAWGAVGVIGLHSLLEYPLWYGPFQVAIVLCWWMLGGKIWLSAHTLRWNPMVATVLLGLMAFIAYDFSQVRQVYLPAAKRWPIWRNQPFEVAHRSWLFQGTALFAEVTTSRVSQDNARWLFEASQLVLHTSPEPRVIEKLLQSAQWLDDDQVHALHRQRFQKVYPNEYRLWEQRQNREATRQ